MQIYDKLKTHKKVLKTVSGSYPTTELSNNTPFSCTVVSISCDSPVKHIYR
jgi:hypothetical protein